MSEPANGHRRVRLAGAVVQLQVVIDDGDTLEPLPTQPINVTVAGLVNLDLDGIVAQLQAQLDRSNAGGSPD